MRHGSSLELFTLEKSSNKEILGYGEIILGSKPSAVLLGYLFSWPSRPCHRLSLSFPYDSQGAFIGDAPRIGKSGCRLGSEHGDCGVEHKARMEVFPRAQMESCG